MLRALTVTLIAFAASATPAVASEAYFGASFHAVDTPFTLDTGEDGYDLQAGIRSAPIEGLNAIGKPSTYLHGQVSLNGDTSLVAAGLSWKIGDKLYARPGIGIALHNDRIREFDANGKRIDLGSRVLFEPELAVGLQVTPKLATELSWVHVSHATLFGGQNPGMDYIGARLVLKLD